MKILVADKISATGVSLLKEQKGFEVIEAYGSSPEKVKELAKEAAAIIVRSDTKITADTLSTANNLKVIGRAGVGVDNIDLDASTEKGVIVMNTPSGNTIATAELTFTHMLCGTRPIAQANASMTEGRWDRKVLSGSELRGKSLAVIGLGRIGGEVAKRAQAFGMTILGYDPYVTEARAHEMDIELVNLEDAFKRADYITVHMPLTDTTRYMIDEKAFTIMKDGVRVFNCARGGIIKESALVEALKSGKVASAGLDVYESEPLAEDSELRKIPNIVLTPHLGASTREAQDNVGLEIAEAIRDTLLHGKIQNAINMPSVDAKTLETIRPLLGLGEKLGTILQQTAEEQVVKLKITYLGSLGEIDTIPLTRSIQRGYLKAISGDMVNDVNAPYKLKQMGIEVESTKSNSEIDYAQLIKVEAFYSNGKSCTISGSLMGNDKPRIVELKGLDIEINPASNLMILENKDTPGMIGYLGTLLGNAKVNIANMSVSRNNDAETALSVYEMDSVPADAIIEEIKAHENIKAVKIVQF